MRALQLRPRTPCQETGGIHSGPGPGTDPYNLSETPSTVPPDRRLRRVFVFLSPSLTPLHLRCRFPPVQVKRQRTVTSSRRTLNGHRSFTTRNKR